MTRILFAVLAVMLGVSIDAQDQECPDTIHMGPPTYLPDYDDCNRYYECIAGTKFHRKCPEILRWDVDNQYCNYSEVTDCGIMCHGKENVEFVRYKQDCSIFAYCVGGIALLYPCPHGKYVDNATHHCTTTTPGLC